MERIEAWIITLAAAVFFGGPSRAAALTLEDYLGQVKKQNQGVQGSQKISVAAGTRTKEWKVLFAPNFFINTTYLYDQRPTLNPAFQGYRNTAKVVSLGVSQLTDWGMTAKLSQNFTQTDFYGVNPTFVPFTSFLDSSPSLELTQSLWKNGFGTETQAQQELIEAQAEMLQFSERYRLKTRLADAELAYWRLSLALQSRAIAQDSTARAQKLVDWADRRFKLDLTDRADYLAAEAGFKLRSFELKAAEYELRAASRSFNSIRGEDSDSVKDDLESTTDELLQAMQIPKRADFRDDVRAAQQSSRVSLANDALAAEKDKPNLDIVANLSYTGRSPNFSDSFKQGYSTLHPYAFVGVKFSTPLNFEMMSDARRAYFEDRKGSELNLSRKLFEQESDWKDLCAKFEEAKVRHSLAREIEAAQKSKNDFEQERLKKAKTTTYNVTLFEQDYLQARLSRIKVEADLLGLVAQMKIYGETYESR